MGQIIGKPTMSAGVRFRLAAALLLIAAACSHAAPPSWTFNPPKAGRALYDGGWTLEYLLGGVNASPEFSFPIQLVYLTTREQKGLFGSEWFCPQLETSLVPKAQGIFVWAMPSGGVVGFKVDPRRSTEYRSFDGNWRAKATASRQVIFNEDGWRFTYSRGRIETAGSPTGRLLEFLYSGSYLASVQIRDPGTGARRVLVALGSLPTTRSAAL